MNPQDPERRRKDRLILIVIFLVIAAGAIFVAVRILAWRSAHSL